MSLVPSPCPLGEGEPKAPNSRAPGHEGPLEVEAGDPCPRVCREPVQPPLRLAEGRRGRWRAGG